MKTQTNRKPILAYIIATIIIAGTAYTPVSAAYTLVDMEDNNIPSLFPQKQSFHDSPDVKAALTGEGNWSFPLDGSWNVVQEFGPSTLFPKKFHLGEDVPRAEGTQVKNARWGYVRRAQCNVTGYGAVVIIESPRDWEASTNPATWLNPRVHLYGHLKCDARLTSIQGKIGKLIDRGATIGTIGSKSENGGWSPHLHFGVRKGRYVSSWVYWGYTTDYNVYRTWYDPSDTINNY
jgi:murein DD-endopeptidase MepM/ murein hydrolase activator NlpD